MSARVPGFVVRDACLVAAALLGAALVVLGVVLGGCGIVVVDEPACETDADCRGLHEECMRLACVSHACVQVPDGAKYTCHTSPAIGKADGLCDHADGTCRPWCASDVECDSGACVGSMCVDTCGGCRDEEGCHPGDQDKRCGRDGGACADCGGTGCASPLCLDGACRCQCSVHTDCPLGQWCDEQTDGGVLLCREP